MSNISLSFSQCKRAIESGIDLRDLVERFNDQPEFITAMQSIDWHDAQSILQGGCASGAYMPAVTYHTALKTMSEHYDSVESFIETSYCETHFEWRVMEENFPSFCTQVLSLAVECWVSQFAEELEVIGWE